MTRAEMVNLSDRLLLAAFGSPFADDPITPGEPGGLLDIAADEVCRSTDCFFDVQSTGLVAGQATYCAPTLYRVTDVYCLDAAGKVTLLIARTPADLTRSLGAGWRDSATADPPQYLVWEGATRVRLSPTPSVTRPDALVWEGFGVTTSKILSGVNGLAAHLWPGEGDECPLPEDGQMAVVYRLCALRCLPLLGKTEAAGAQMAAFTAEYRRERGDLEANAARRYPSRRVGPLFARSIGR